MVKELFNPETIAIVGASNHPGKVGGILMQKALVSKCKIIPINSGHSEIFDLKCYNSILDVDGKIDLVVIAVPKDFVLKVIEECGVKGVKNVIIVSAGFSEVGDREAESRIISIAKKNNIRILGPNCFGIFNPKLNLDLTFANKTPKKGEIAFISQSGALWSYFADLEIGFSGFVGLGNMADLEFNDFIEYFSADKNTKKIVLYIEKLKDGKKFIEVCKKAIRHGKKIYAVKAGFTKKGVEATFSHTASLASDYEIYKGVFRQAGVVFCETIEEALGLGKQEEKQKKIKLGKRVSIFTNAGGAGALVSDYLSSKEYEIVQNKDLLGTANSRDYSNALKNSFDYDWALVIVTPQSMTDVEEIARVLVDANKFEKKAIALFLGKKSIGGANKVFSSSEVLFFNNFKSFVDFLEA
jgi:acetyltransferase